MSEYAVLVSVVKKTMKIRLIDSTEASCSNGQGPMHLNTLCVLGAPSNARSHPTGLHTDIFHDTWDKLLQLDGG